MAEVLLYQGIDAYSAQQFAVDMAAAKATDGSAEIIICGPGGSPEYTQAMLNTLRNFDGDTSIEVAGMAYSGYAFFCAFVKGKVTSVETAQYLIHRAAYPEYWESYPGFFDAATIKNLNDLNSDLKKAVKNKVDIAKLEEIAGKTYPGIKFNDIFALTDKNGKYNRPDIFLTAKEAKAIGLIDEIIPMSPAKSAMHLKQFATAQARYDASIPPSPAPKTEAIPAPNKQISKKSTMATTLEELKEENPTLYAQAIAAGKTDGAKAEAKRRAGWDVWANVDALAVKKGIESGEEISMAEISQFSRKALNPKAIKDLEDENAEVVETEADKTTAATAATAIEEKAKADFEKELKEIREKRK